MNSRIEELWDKAAESTLDQSWQSQTAFMERFAELIVRECAQVASDWVKEPTMLSIENKIKWRFGVE